MAEFKFNLAKFIPFRDEKACARVRKITKDEICNHPNPDFNIRIIEEPEDFYFEFALDIVRRIQETKKKGERCILIVPAGPMPQYRIAARLINKLKSPVVMYIPSIWMSTPMETEKLLHKAGQVLFKKQCGKVSSHL